MIKEQGLSAHNWNHLANGQEPEDPKPINWRLDWLLYLKETLAASWRGAGPNMPQMRKDQRNLLPLSWGIRGI